MGKHLLSTKISSMTESATIKMAQNARALKSQGIDIISLSLGEPDFDTPDFIKAAAKKALDAGETKYTPVPGHLILREAICNKLKRDNNLDYKPDQIVVSNGAKQCIANTCLSLVDPGDEVIIFTPYWVSYYDIVKFVGGTPVTVYAGIDQDFKVKPDQLKAAITSKTKLIIFSSPSNPTGSVYTEQELRELAAVISKTEGVFVLSDEIYELINFSNKNPSIATMEGMQERTITINGMSKGYAMTGWRLGYMAAPAFIAKACSTVQGQFTSGAASFNQLAAAHALDQDTQVVRYMADKFLTRKNMVKALLDDIPGIRTNDPQGAFYFFPDISEFFGRSNGTRTINNSEDFTDVLLTEAHVAVVAGTAFGDPSCFRISYATSDDILREAMRRIKATLSTYS